MISIASSVNQCEKWLYTWKVLPLWQRKTYINKLHKPLFHTFCSEKFGRKWEESHFPFLSASKKVVKTPHRHLKKSIGKRTKDHRTFSIDSKLIFHAQQEFFQSLKSIFLKLWNRFFVTQICRSDTYQIFNRILFFNHLLFALLELNFPIQHK